MNSHFLHPPKKNKVHQGTALGTDSLDELACQQEIKWEQKQANSPSACTQPYGSVSASDRDLQAPL